MINPNFKCLTETAKLPTMSYGDDAGIDFYSPVDVTINPKEFELVDLGVTWAPEFTQEVGVISYNNFNISLILKARSGLAVKENIEVSTGGVIDQGYRGHIKAKIINRSITTKYIKKGDKIVQGLIFIQPKLIGVEILEKGTRGGGGFGSTGT